MLTWTVVACAVGLAIGLAAFALVSGPYRIVAAAVLGLAGTLALWPMSPAAQAAGVKGMRLGSGRRLAELEQEVARLTAAVAKQEADRQRLVAVLQDLESWARAQEAPAAEAEFTNGAELEPALPVGQHLKVAAGAGAEQREANGVGHGGGGQWS